VLLPPPLTEDSSEGLTTVAMPSGLAGTSTSLLLSVASLPVTDAAVTLAASKVRVLEALSHDDGLCEYSDAMSDGGYSDSSEGLATVAMSSLAGTSLPLSVASLSAVVTLAIKVCVLEALSHDDGLWEYSDVGYPDVSPDDGSEGLPKIVREYKEPVTDPAP
jgi:hypothetical protein